VTSSAEIKVDRRDNVVVARLSGEVDMSNSPYVSDELTHSVPNDAVALVIDLSEARYLDSAGIELLFELSRRLARRRQSLHLAVPEGSSLRRVLVLTDIDSVAPMHDSVDSAVAAV
jgi:anti-sigma B factor antagonist